MSTSTESGLRFTKELTTESKYFQSRGMISKEQTLDITIYNVYTTTLMFMIIFYSHEKETLISLFLISIH